MQPTPPTAFDGVRVFVLMSADQFEEGCARAEVEHLTLAELLRRLLSEYLERVA